MSTVVGPSNNLECMWGVVSSDMHKDHRVLVVAVLPSGTYDVCECGPSDSREAWQDANHIARLHNEYLIKKMFPDNE